MSDQDFFFDDEEPVRDKKNAAKASAKGGASGQKTAPAKGGTTGQKKAAPAPVATSQFLDRSITMSVAGLLMAIALLVGVIVGFLMNGAMSPSAASSAAAQAPGSGTSPAAALTQDQLSQPLPPGHVPVSGGPTGSVPATGSATGTGK